MGWCAAEDECQREGEGRWVEDREEHPFQGYGYRIVFHPECCPREFDGTDCRREHRERETDCPPDLTVAP